MLRTEVISGADAAAALDKSLIRSETWDSPAQLAVRNSTKQNIKIAWVNYEGAEQRPGEGVAPASEWKQSSYATHWFSVRNAGASDQLILLFRLHSPKVPAAPCRASFVIAESADGHISCQIMAPEGHASGSATEVCKALARDYEYMSHDACGWQVHVNADMANELVDRTLDTMRSDLAMVRSILPAAALAVVLKVRFFVNSETHYGADGEPTVDGRGMCFHMSPEWLRANGNCPDKAGAIEIYRAADYLEWRTHQPMMLLHELSHAYHTASGSALDARIGACFDAAVASRRYESVDYVCTPGVKARAYALTNATEFFAELSEAFWGRNDYFPFTRSDLLSFDPEAYAMVRDAWGAEGV